MATTRVNYPSRAVEAARRVMLELVRLLGEYCDDIVVVGGWVPELLFPDADHIGSTDVDLALDHRALQDPGYATVLTLLKSRGFDTPPAEAGGFFLQPEPPATAKAAAGLTLSPEAITASPAAKTF